MDFTYLDFESESKLEEILGYQELTKHTLRGYVIENLVNNGYLVGHCVTTLSDAEPCYLITAITQKGKSYFELKEKYEKEQKRLSRREWKIAIVSAVLGAIIGLIPTLIQLF